MTDFAEQLQNALGTGYQLESELTGGGMSRVFVAIDRALGRKVVVKVLPPDLAAGVNRERFRREIQVAAQLHHPHIVPLLSAGEQGDLLWYTMPFIDGESLRTALERKNPFGVREVTRIMHDVVDALAFAHARGVIHRDIKPGNILRQGAHALVTDFGVAKALSAAMPISGVTSAGIAIGTPAYMAPEQLAGDAAADHRIDIYAVGLLAYELLTGSSPFTGPSPRETLAAQLTRDPKPLHEVSPEVPRTLSALVMRCLAKDPAARPQRADEILHELDAMTMPLGVTPQSEGVDAEPRRRSTAILLATTAALVVVAAVYGLSRRGPASSPRPDSSAAARAAVKSNPTAPVAPISPVQSGGAPVVTPPAVAPPVKPAPIKPVITHEDSIRIAEVVRKRFAAAKARDSITQARLQAEAERKMMDSIIAANGGAASSSTGPRRLVITEPPALRQWPEAALLGRAVADSLRRMLRARPKQYTIIDPDSVRLAMTTSRDLGELTKNLSSDLAVSIRITVMPHDSAFLLFQVADLGAITSYRSRVASSRAVPKNEVLGTLDQMLLSVLTFLDEMSRAPRRGS
jgi:eukaryotic-like serine/threonine-protein kinase